jgi:hypothetical protein
MINGSKQKKSKCNYEWGKRELKKEENIKENTLLMRIKTAAGRHWHVLIYRIDEHHRGAFSTVPRGCWPSIFPPLLRDYWDSVGMSRTFLGSPHSQPAFPGKFSV